MGKGPADTITCDKAGVLGKEAPLADGAVGNGRSVLYEYWGGAK